MENFFFKTTIFLFLFFIFFCFIFMVTIISYIETSDLKPFIISTLCFIIIFLNLTGNTPQYFLSVSSLYYLINSIYNNIISEKRKLTFWEKLKYFKEKYSEFILSIKKDPLLYIINFGVIFIFYFFLRIYFGIFYTNYKDWTVSLCLLVLGTRNLLDLIIIKINKPELTIINALKLVRSRSTLDSIFICIACCITGTLLRCYVISFWIQLDTEKLFTRFNTNFTNLVNWKLISLIFGLLLIEHKKQTPFLLYGKFIKTLNYYGYSRNRLQSVISPTFLVLPLGQGVVESDTPMNRLDSTISSSLVSLQDGLNIIAGNSTSTPSEIALTCLLLRQHHTATEWKIFASIRANLFSPNIENKELAIDIYKGTNLTNYRAGMTRLYEQTEAFASRNRLSQNQLNYLRYAEGQSIAPCVDLNQQIEQDKNYLYNRISAAISDLEIAKLKQSILDIKTKLPADIIYMNTRYNDIKNNRVNNNVENLNFRRLLVINIFSLQSHCLQLDHLYKQTMWKSILRENAELKYLAGDLYNSQEFKDFQNLSNDICDKDTVKHYYKYLPRLEKGIIPRALIEERDNIVFRDIKRKIPILDKHLDEVWPK